MADAAPQFDESDADAPAASFFPDPPPFYKHFTADNLARLNDMTGGADASTLSADHILALPTELRYLLPPEPPADHEEFHVFNETAKAKGTNVFDKNMEYISEMLRIEGVFPEGWKYTQLPDESGPVDAFTALTHQQKLYSCVRSLLLSYVRLLGIMASNPTASLKSDTLEDMLTLVANMHALINEYRPHQARETLIEKMEAQVERKKKEIERVNKVAARVRGVLEGFGHEAEQLQNGHERKTEKELSSQDEERQRIGSQRLMWETMDEILGH